MQFFDRECIASDLLQSAILLHITQCTNVFHKKNCRVVSVASQYVRYLLFCNRVKSVNRNDVSTVLRKCYYGDWFILMQLAKHINPAIFHDVVLDLRDKLDAKRAANLQD